MHCLINCSYNTVLALVDLCRILTQNNMKAIGRNYYKPEDAVRIPNHGLVIRVL